MRDPDIRKTIIAELTQRHLNDPETMIVEELGLCEGESRIDIAVINGSIHGFEIKSDQDTLRRLAGQIATYGRTLDRVTLIVSNTHLNHALNMIPTWWSVIRVQEKGGQPCLRQVRKGRVNPQLDAFSVAQFLWRDEAFEILKMRNLHRGLAKKPRAVLWKAVAECMSIRELTATVRRSLKSRQNWRSDSRQE